MNDLDETEYLLSSEKNKEVLMHSVKQAKYSLSEPIVDVKTVIMMLQNLDIFELDEVVMECDYLIDNIKNSYSD